MKHDDRDELDGLIDRALSEYTNHEPMEGLEERVLRRIDAAAAVRQRPWPFRLWFAIPALASLLIVGIAVRVAFRPQPPLPKPAPPVALVTPSRLAAAPIPRTAKPHRRTRRVSGRLPKLEMFPTPEPMTPQERALVEWSRRAPAEVQQALADIRRRSDEPITIQALQIPPLPSDGVQ